jgi:hypothetical protein
VNVPESLVWKKIKSMVAGSRQLTAPKDECVSRRETQDDLTIGLLDAYIPGNERTTTLFFGHIVSNPNAKSAFPRFLGYNMTYSGCQPKYGNAYHTHNSLEIFVNVDASFGFAHVPSATPQVAEDQVVLGTWDLIAIPAGVYRRFWNASERHAQLMTLLPGRASVTWAHEVIASAKKHGADCDDSGILKTSEAKRLKAMAQAIITPVYLGVGGLANCVVRAGGCREWKTEHGWIRVGTRKLAPGEVWEPPAGKDFTVVVLGGAVLGPGTQPLAVLDAVCSPGPLRALAEPAHVLVIESQLPHHDQFAFAPPL